MNYEFHVGDYVETAGGFVGWVSYVDENDKSCICITDKCGTMSGPWHPLSNEYHFLRIGAYDFTKKEKKTIKKLNLQGYLSTQTIASVVNELVDAVNLLLDKSTES